MHDFPFVNILFISPVKSFSFLAAFDSFSSHIEKILLINSSTVASFGSRNASFTSLWNNKNSQQSKIQNSYFKPYFSASY